MSDFNNEIDSVIFKDHLDYCRGVIVFKWLNNKHESPKLSRLFREVENKLRDRVTGNSAEHPMIATQTYGKC